MKSSWEEEMSLKKTIIFSSLAANEFLQATVEQEVRSAEWRRRAEGYEAAATLQIKAAEAYRIGNLAEGKRCDKEAEKTFYEVINARNSSC